MMPNEHHGDDWFLEPHIVVLVDAACIDPTENIRLILLCTTVIHATRYLIYSTRRLLSFEMHLASPRDWEGLK